MNTPGAARLIRGVTILALGTAVVALSGCGAIAKELSDGDFAETIPAALAASDIGVTDSYAAKTISGFTFF